MGILAVYGFLIPTNSAAISILTYTFSLNEFHQKEPAASMSVCTLHFMTHYKFISLTDSNLASTAMSVTTKGGGGGGAVYSMLPRPRDIFPPSIYFISQGNLASRSIPPSWSHTFLLVLLLLAAPSPFPSFPSPLLLEQVLEHSDSVLGPLFYFCTQSHSISSDLINCHGFKYHAVRQQLLNFLFPTRTSFFIS